MFAKCINTTERAWVVGRGWCLVGLADGNFTLCTDPLASGSERSS